MATKSNKDAIGSEVTVKTKGSIQTQQMMANNGTAQSELVLHFGLNNQVQAEEVIVRWPSGQKQIFQNISAGTVILKEESPKINRMAAH